MGDDPDIWSGDPGKDPAVVRGVRGETAYALEILADTLEAVFRERPGPEWDSGDWIGTPPLELYLEVPWDFSATRDGAWPCGLPKWWRAVDRPTLDCGFRWLRSPAIPAELADLEQAALRIDNLRTSPADLRRAGRVALEDRWRALSVVTHSAIFLEDRDEGWDDMPAVRDSYGARYAVPRGLKDFLDQRIGTDEAAPDRAAAVDGIAGGYLVGSGIYFPHPLPVSLGEPLLDLLDKDFPDRGQLPPPVFDAGGMKAAAIVRFAPLMMSLGTQSAIFRVEASVVVFAGEAGDTKRFPSRGEVPAVAAGLRELAARYRPEAGAEQSVVVAPDEPAGGVFVRATPPVQPRPKSLTPLLDVRARTDPETQKLNSFAVSGTLPRSWRKARRWDEIEGEEIEKRLAAHGNDAFTKAPGRPPLLVMKKDGPALPPKDRTELAVACGSRGGFITSDKDGEWLCRALRVGVGWVTVEIAWFRSTERLISSRREAWAADLQARLKDESGQQRLSFVELGDEDRRRVEQVLEHLGTLDDARHLLDVVLRRAAAEGCNVVDIPARELRVLLQCDGPDGRGNERIRRGFAALEELSFRVQHRALKGLPNGRFQGRFVAMHGYYAGGDGAHSDGIFVVELSSAVPGVAGLLNEAERGKRKIDESKAETALKATGRATSRAVDLLTGRKPRIRDQRQKGDRPAKAVSTVGPWRKRAICSTIYEERAFDFLEGNLTTSLAADTLGRSKRQRRAGATSDGLRTYTRSWCPLLPAGEWVGILGTHRRNPESGWRLAGKAAPATGTGGQRPSGLIDQLGRAFPSGGAREERRRAAVDTLEDFAHVVNTLGGVLAGVHGGGGERSKPSSWPWISLEEALELPPKDLLGVRWYPFLPADWHRRADAIVEKTQAGRVERGESDLPVFVTRRPAEYLAAAEAAGVQWEHRPGSDEEFVTWHDDGRPAAPVEVAQTLGERLEERIAETGIRKVDLARAFGVSPATVSRWIRPVGERKTMRGSGVPAALAGLVERWVAGGELPSAEELGAVSSRHGKPRR